MSQRGFGCDAASQIGAVCTLILLILLVVVFEAFHVPLDETPFGVRQVTIATNPVLKS